VNLIRLAYLKEIKTSAYKNSPVLVLMSWSDHIRGKLVCIFQCLSVSCCNLMLNPQVTATKIALNRNAFLQGLGCMNEGASVYNTSSLCCLTHDSVLQMSIFGCRTRLDKSVSPKHNLFPVIRIFVYASWNFQNVAGHKASRFQNVFVNIKFYQNASIGSRVVPCGQTDMT
jgi:hypothetical protein